MWILEKRLDRTVSFLQNPHLRTVRSNLSKLLGADPSVVNLRAKTHENVKSLGENRIIAADTVILLMKK